MTRDHLDEHGDLASYGNAKRRLFRLPGLRCAVVNADDPFGASLGADLPRGCELMRTSTRGAGAELIGRVRRSDLAGLDLEIAGKFGSARLRSKLIGTFNAENLLRALGALLAQGCRCGGAARRSAPRSRRRAAWRCSAGRRRSRGS